MAKTLDQLQAEFDTLDSAINAGQQTVRYADKSVTYYSLAEMERSLDRLQRRIDFMSGTRRKQQVRFITKDGYG